MLRDAFLGQVLVDLHRPTLMPEKYLKRQVSCFNLTYKSVVLLQTFTMLLYPHKYFFPRFIEI